MARMPRKRLDCPECHKTFSGGEKGKRRFAEHWETVCGPAWVQDLGHASPRAAAVRFRESAGEELEAATVLLDGLDGLQVERLEAERLQEIVPRMLKQGRRRAA